MAYKLTLPSEAKIHHVFHVSVLKLYHGEVPGSISPLPPLSDAKGAVIQPEFILQARQILRNSQPVKQLLISWTGLSSSESSWEDLKLLAKILLYLQTLRTRSSLMGGQM